jgi:hypothetical protein
MQTNVTRSTDVAEAPKASPADVSEHDITIYSHSPIFYWWPVWLAGFLMALLTYLDGGLMATVPDGTEVAGNTLVAPEGTALLEPPRDRMARSPHLGTWFFLILLVVVLPNVFIRHRILGFWGAGDLVVRTGGPHPEVLEWPNVLFVRSRLKQIQARLKQRDVV